MISLLWRGLIDGYLSSSETITVSFVFGRDGKRHTDGGSGRWYRGISAGIEETDF